MPDSVGARECSRSYLPCHVGEPQLSQLPLPRPLVTVLQAVEEARCRVFRYLLLWLCEFPSAQLSHTTACHGQLSLWLWSD